MRKFKFTTLAMVMAAMPCVSFMSCSSNDDDTPESPVEMTSYLECPDNHHPHLIDMGLPSGTKWACCNVGADIPEEYGGYYAWGETEEKTDYEWYNYELCDHNELTVRNISMLAHREYDVAHVKWGNTWIMPSKTQFEELCEKTANHRKTVNGVLGREFIGKNGGTIFIPAAGYRYGLYSTYEGTDGVYWTSTPDSYSSYSKAASALFFNIAQTTISSLDRCEGVPVRAVSQN